MVNAILKALLRSGLKVAPDKLLRFLRHELKQDDLTLLLKDMMARDVSVATIYDIGAHKGDWAKEVKTILPQAEIFMFEANETNKPFLEKTGFWYRISVLSDTLKEVTFYRTGGTGDSYYKENTGAFRDVAPVTVQANTLDNIVTSEGLPAPDFIKIDTQGSEIDILKGAPESLKSAKLILLECPIYTYNLNAPNMEDYVTFLKSKGFYPAKSVEIHYLMGVFTQVDIVFIHQDIIKTMDKEFDAFYL